MSVSPAPTRSQSIVIQVPEKEDSGKGSCANAATLQGAATANLVQPLVVFFALVAGLVLLAIVSMTMKESGGGKALVGFIMAIAGLVFVVVVVQFVRRYMKMEARLEGKESNGNVAKPYNVQDYYSDSMMQRGAMVEMMGAVILVVAGGAAFSQM